MNTATCTLDKLCYLEKNAMPDTQKTQAGSPAKEAPARKRVLLVDDEASVRIAVKQVLKAKGYEVVEAAGGPEGMEKYQAGTFDCVLTDHMMPQMSGAELTARIKAINPAQRVVLFTASADRLARDQMPWDSLLAKPFSVDDLLAALHAPKKS
jgi:CheY-like chemotaxis protein